MMNISEERRGLEEGGVYMWGNDNRLQLTVRQHFKTDQSKIRRACLVVWSERAALELPPHEVDDHHQDG